MSTKKILENKTEPAKMKFRYVCDACTGVALQSTNAPVGLKIVCKHCGKEQITKPENFIAL